MRIRAGEGWARIEVGDEGPAARPVSPGNGWGLTIVADVSDRAGADLAPAAAGPAGLRPAGPDPLTR